MTNEKRMKYEFDNLKEYSEAMEHLEDYHDCEKCHDKIVVIGVDKFGNTLCGYCGQIVRYPRLKREAIEKCLKNEKKKEKEFCERRNP